MLRDEAAREAAVEWAGDKTLSDRVSGCGARLAVVVVVVLVARRPPAGNFVAWANCLGKCSSGCEAIGAEGRCVLPDMFSNQE